MNKSNTIPAGYLLAGGLGALAGGLAVIAVTRAIPKMMYAMMNRTTTQMQDASCDPSEM